jgi:type 1 glutamine amidotransferase
MKATLLTVSMIVLCAGFAVAQQPSTPEQPKVEAKAKPKAKTKAKAAPKLVVPPDVNGRKTVIAPPLHRQPIKVGIYRGPGAPRKGVDAIVKVMKPFPEATIVILSGEQVGTADINNFDVLVFPGGSGSGQSKGIGKAGVKNVREFVHSGGGYVGICAGAYLACSNFSWGLGILNAGTVPGNWRRGNAILELQLTDAGKPLLGDVNEAFKVRYHNGPILKPWTRQDLLPYTPLALFRTEVANNGAPVGVQIQSPAQAIGAYGKGRVFVSSPHPESTPGLENLIPRAIFWAAAQQATAALPTSGGNQ